MVSVLYQHLLKASYEFLPLDRIWCWEEVVIHKLNTQVTVAVLT